MDIIQREKVLLIIEDEKKILEGYCDAFTNTNWKIIRATNGNTAISLIESGVYVTVILLDYKLPDINGLKIIEKIKDRDKGILIPPIFVISAYTEIIELDSTKESEIECIIQKPINPEMLPNLLNAFCENNEAELLKIYEKYKKNFKLKISENNQNRIYYFKNSNLKNSDSKFDGRTSLHNTTEQREQALIKYFKTRIEDIKPLIADEPLLIVTRKWNSWYPSFFNVTGGAYTILAPQSHDETVYGSVIDPGFKALDTLIENNIPLSSLQSCVLTHNHPDHIGGIFELFTTRYTFDKKNVTTAFCAPSVWPMLNTYAHPGLAIKEFKNMPVDIIEKYRDKGGITRKISATPFLTSHLNIGQKDGTQGISISSDIIEEDNQAYSESILVIAGDTEYHCNKLNPNKTIFDTIRAALLRPTIKIAVLHIGSSQLKSGIGKHLYLTGLIDILKDIEHYRNTELDHKAPKLLVLVSEWGLEHADCTQITNAIHGPLPDYIKAAFNNKNLMLETIKVIEDSFKFEKIILLPADSGLIAGINSGKIYTSTRGPLEPRDIKITLTPNGITYT